MDEFPGEAAPEPTPVSPPGTADDFFQQAESARRGQVWEEAIRLYRIASQKDPSHKDVLHGLALSYQAKGREPGYESYQQAAMGEYRKLIALDPSDMKAHDALLASAVKQDLLGDLLEEYQARITKGGNVDVFRVVLRKIQALLLLRADPVKKELAAVPPIISFLFGLLAPGLGLISLVAALFIRMKTNGSAQGAMISYGLMKLSFGGLFSFIGYKIFLYWRVSS